MKIQYNISLKPYNTFAVDVTAAEFMVAEELDDLVNFICSGQLRGKKFLVLGGGSNILFTHDFDGLVIKNNIAGIEENEMGKNNVLIKAGGGMVWDDLVHYCMDKGYGGIENLVMIPGSVGAGPIQNIGAYGVELKDTFHSLEAVEVETGKLKTFSNEECTFGYRDSIFKREHKGKYVIVSVSLLLYKDHVPDVTYGAIKEELQQMGIKGEPGILDVGAAVMAIRSKKLPDPEEIGNAGSFFKNPLVSEEKYHEICDRYPGMPSYKGVPGMLKVPAGWLIEQCGWKGKVDGNAGVHDKQALVLVNKGQATGAEIFMLAQKIKTSVSDEFGIDLEMEVNII